MRYLIKVIMLFSTIFFTLGCVEEKEKNKIIIDVKEIANVSVHECFDRIELIPLETSQNLLIRYIMKIIHFEDDYFIIDYNKNVYKINKEGKFLYEIGEVGRGPEEHLEVVDFQINEFTNNLELLIPHGRIDIFSTEGEYIESYTLGTYAHEFINLNEDLILIHFSVGENKLNFYSRAAGKVIAQKYRMDKEVNQRIPVGDTAPIWRWNGNIYFQYPFSNDIYMIRGKQLDRYYSLDFGKYNFNISDINWETGLNGDYYNEKIRESSNIATFFQFHIENDRIILKRFLNGDAENMPLFLYDKSTLDTKVFIDFEEGVRMPMLYNYDSQDQIVYAAVDPNDINKYIALELLDSEEREKLEEIEMSDNPIIVKYYLK